MRGQFFVLTEVVRELRHSSAADVSSLVSIITSLTGRPALKFSLHCVDLKMEIKGVFWLI